MPNFATHITFGKLFSVAFALLMASVMYRMTASITGMAVSAIIALMFGTTASVAPDIDHHNSKPYRAFRSAATIVTVIAILWLQYQGWDIILMISKAIIEVTTIDQLTAGQLSYVIGGAIASTAGVAVRELIEVLRPKHRGILHTITAHSTFAGLKMPILHSLFVEASIPMPWAQATIAGTAWVMGATLHIFMDKIYTRWL